MAGWRATIAVYGAGEAINGAGALAPEIRRQLDRLARVATNRDVAATAQLDSSGGKSLRYVLDPRGQLPVESLPNINTGDPAVLRDYVAWSTAICPAERLVLVLSGHGIAWQDSEADAALGLTRAPGAPPRRPGCFHNPRTLFGSGATKAAAMQRAVLLDGHDRDYLSNAELGAVCQRIAAARGGPIDVLVLDACLMSAVEVLHELRGAVATIVGAVDEISASGIDMAEPAAWMTATADLTPAAIAGHIAGNFTPVAAFDSCVAIDIGGPAWGNGIAAFQAFAQALAGWAVTAPGNAALVKAALRLAATSVVQYSRGGLADLSALVAAMASVGGMPGAVVAAGRRADAAFRAAVIGRSVGADYRDACGLSVFAPGSDTVFAANHAEYARLQFPTLTGWGAVLDVVYGYDSDNVRLATRAVGGAMGEPAPDFAIPIDAGTLRRLAAALHAANSG
jgi:Clostripain family